MKWSEGSTTDAAVVLRPVALGRRTAPIHYARTVPLTFKTYSGSTSEVHVNVAIYGQFSLDDAAMEPLLRRGVNALAEQLSERKDLCFWLPGYTASLIHQLSGSQFRFDEKQSPQPVNPTISPKKVFVCSAGGNPGANFGSLEVKIHARAPTSGQSGDFWGVELWLINTDPFSKVNVKAAPGPSLFWATSSLTTTTSLPFLQGKITEQTGEETMELAPGSARRLVLGVRHDASSTTPSFPPKGQYQLTLSNELLKPRDDVVWTHQTTFDVRFIETPSNTYQ